MPEHCWRCLHSVLFLVLAEILKDPLKTMETQNKTCDISFCEKSRIFSRDYLRCCLYIANSDVAPQHLFTKRLFSKLTSTSLNLEDFLDFHGAKNNKNWYYYRELAAAVRHLSLGGNFQKHLSNRLVFYELPDTEQFEKEGERTFAFITRVLVEMAPLILDEARRLDICLPRRGFDPSEFPGVSTSELLAYDIDDEAKGEQKKNIVKIASEFLNIAKNFEELAFYEIYTPEQILEIVPDKVNEVEIRHLEMLVHNLQSSFDTYVIHGGFRYGNRKLKLLRSYFSVVFHLLQMTGRLLHFYERHLHEAGYKNTYKKVQERLARTVDPEILLDRTVNYGLFYACQFLTRGKELAREIMNENIERATITVGIPVKLGFHTRPSLLVAKIVQHYGGQVELCVGPDRFDASSVLDIQWAGGQNPQGKFHHSGL